MAHFVPDTLPDFAPGAKAERALLDALRGLPDGVHVYPRFQYLEGERAAEGEVDALVVHPELGLLAIECKGFGVRRDGHGRWTRLRPDGGEEPLKESPFEQAQRHVRELEAALRKRLASAMPELGDRLPFTFGHAVAFPMTRLGEVRLPAGIDRRLVFDADDLARLPERVEEALRFWRSGRPAPRGLSRAEWKRFRRSVLHPTLELAPCIGARLRLDDEAMTRLSGEQVQMVRGVLANRRITVSGGAGTGKTALALTAARAFAEQGDVLVVCFNRALARHLEGLCEDEPRILVRSFHALCAEAAGLLGKSVQPPAEPEAAKLYWDLEMPTLLSTALGEGLARRFDAVVVDEGQDLQAEWWPIVEDCLRDRRGGRFAIFHDSAQSIFGRPSAVPAVGASFELVVNFRNSKRIGEALARLTGQPALPHDRAPEGEPVVVHGWEGREKTLRTLDALVASLLGQHRLEPDDLTILSPHRPENSLLAGCEALGGVPLARDPLDRGRRVLHTTIGSFKGLESPAVILIDVDPADPRCGRSERYVAASRARLLLHVFCKGDFWA